jgi:hypothetical protein
VITQATLDNTKFSAVELAAIEGFVNNLLTYYDQANDTLFKAGASWYRYAQTFCERVARECKITPKMAAFVIAALSNNIPWEDQVRDTIPFVLHIRRGGDWNVSPGRFLPACKEKAARILAGDFDALTGPKVTVFARNMLGDYTHVTIDRHAVRGALRRHTDDNETSRWVAAKGKKRKMLEAAYHEASRLRAIEPAILQAVVWTVYRGSSGF